MCVYCSYVVEPAPTTDDASGAVAAPTTGTQLLMPLLGKLLSVVVCAGGTARSLRQRGVRTWAAGGGETKRRMYALHACFRMRICASVICVCVCVCVCLCVCVCVCVCVCGVCVRVRVCVYAWWGMCVRVLCCDASDACALLFVKYIT